MKKILILLICLFALFTSCKGFLDLEPLDRVPGSELFKDEAAIKANMATLYYMLPIEDFAYNPRGGFNYYDATNSPLGFSTSFRTDESMNSAGTFVIPNMGPVSGYWGYGPLRETNEFLEALKGVNLPQEMLDKYVSEAHFIRAYIYFGMAKRYGGVPIIEAVQDMGGDIYVPRSTEKEIWDYIIGECDLAIAHLPTSWSKDDGVKRATVWAACALKARAALHAASIAKYWDRANLIGDAVSQKLVGGMTTIDAQSYYKICIDACDTLIQHSGKTLYKATPVDVAEAIVNYQTMFEAPENADVQSSEVIFGKAFVDGSVSKTQGHSFDVFFSPSQGSTGYFAYGRYSPVLDIVDLYEDYTDDGQGNSSPIVTRTDGMENVYLADPIAGFNGSVSYKKYTTPKEAFADKDARFHASILYSGSVWKGQEIVIQGGLINTVGTASIYVEATADGNDGKTYHTYGADGADKYSGYRSLGSYGDANFSCTGFSIRKFLQEKKTVASSLFSSSTEYIDFRLAEIYLAYAEAVVESGQGSSTLAEGYLNAIRKRAAHTDNIPLTIDNVLKERRVELAFEGHRYWDLVRRRDFHTQFNSRIRKSLLPMVDLRESTPKYIFVRTNNYYDNGANGLTFRTYSYYLPIPGTASNKLIQNPQY